MPTDVLNRPAKRISEEEEGKTFNEMNGSI